MKQKNKLDVNLLIQYQEKVLVPVYWIKQADELILASKKLVPSIKKYWITISNNFDSKKGTYNPPPKFKPKKLLQATYFMLVAYAIENYIKSILIRKFETTYKNEIWKTGKLPNTLIGHKLIELVKKTNLILSPEEENLLSRLSRNSIWQGRYPVPVDAIQLNSTAIHNGDLFFTAFFTLPDISNLNILTRRIRRECTKNLSPEEKLYLKI